MMRSNISIQISEDLLADHEVMLALQALLVAMQNASKRMEEKFTEAMSAGMPSLPWPIRGPKG